MKYCICIRGLHYTHNNIIIDYKKSFDNYKTMLFQPLIDKGDEIFIFLLTYESPVITQLLDDYKPVSTQIIPLTEIDSIDTFGRQKTWHLHSVNMIQTYENNNSITFDYILNTRFDLFYTNLIFTNIIHSKINIIFKHCSGNCDDNFFLFPRSMLPIFENGIKDIMKEGKMTHEICHYMNEKENIHYICPIPEKNYETIFKFARIK
jgi:hypothetical protein